MNHMAKAYGSLVCLLSWRSYVLPDHGNHFVVVIPCNSYRMSCLSWRPPQRESPASQQSLKSATTFQEELAIGMILKVNTC